MRSASFPMQAQGLKDTPAAKAIDARHKSWEERMPKDKAGLWDWLTGLSGDEQAPLFAHCASFGVNALYEKGDRYGGGVTPHTVEQRITEADRIAKAVDLDMVEAGWRPTVENYLGRVPKRRILEAVREGAGERAAQLIDHLKKGDMAKEAERLLAETGWLPEPLRMADADHAATVHTTEHERDDAVWLSKSDKLLEDAQRDWSALGMERLLVTPLSRFPQGRPIVLSEDILFLTYATLRSDDRGEKLSRVRQIVQWLGSDFDGVIIFDESHAMQNAGGKGERGDVAPSQQGRAGLRLQHALPNARVVYVSATGATTVHNLAYAQRLGLWGGEDFPFATRAEFVEAIEEGGVAAMEVLARDLRALGLYTARSLSYDGVEYELVEHQLTDEQRRIYDAYASAFSVTRLEPDLEDLLWSTVNVFHRAIDRIERELDDNELAQQRSQREHDGSEIKSVELERLTAEGQTLIERRGAFELMRDQAADEFECHRRQAM